MDSDKLRVSADAIGLLVGVACIAISLGLFTWLLPLVLPTYIVLTVAGVMVAMLAWFLFLVLRS